jgi:Protein of unknown function (DUF2971)
MKLLENFYSQKPTVPLAHYTSASGLSGVLSSKSLWATHIRFLNDSKEFVHAVGLAREYLETLRSRPSMTTNGLLTDVLFGHLDAMLGNTWIVSFSENGDLLSQWRGYCPTGGYVINFQPQRLEALAGQQQQRFILAKCTYSRDEQVTLVKSLIDATYESFKEYRAPSPNANLIEDYFCSKWFFPKMYRLGSLMKDPTFFEEKEWRLIGGLYQPHTIPSYRCNAPLVIPHQVFNLALQGALDDVMESITIGPTFDQELAELGLFFFKQNAGVHISTKRSAIPFRQTK